MEMRYVPGHSNELWVLPVCLSANVDRKWAWWTDMSRGRFFLAQSSKMGTWSEEEFPLFSILYECVITPADIFARHICSPVFFLFDIYLLSSFTEQANPLIQCWLNRESRPYHVVLIAYNPLGTGSDIVHSLCSRDKSCGTNYVEINTVGMSRALRMVWDAYMG